MFVLVLLVLFVVATFSLVASSVCGSRFGFCFSICVSLGVHGKFYNSVESRFSAFRYFVFVSSFVHSNTTNDDNSVQHDGVAYCSVVFSVLTQWL